MSLFTGATNAAPAYAREYAQTLFVGVAKKCRVPWRLPGSVWLWSESPAHVAPGGNLAHLAFFVLREDDPNAAKIIEDGLRLAEREDDASSPTSQRPSKTVSPSPVLAGTSPSALKEWTSQKTPWAASL